MYFTNILKPRGLNLLIAETDGRGDILPPLGDECQ
jgi:hypothetical protein